MPASHLALLMTLEWLKTPVLILFFIASVLLVFIVLIQRGKGGGLTGAFGMGGESTVLGTKAGTFLGKVTAVLGAIFLGLALIYVMLDFASKGH